MSKRPLVLTILDEWGYRVKDLCSAITPVRIIFSVALPLALAQMVSAQSVPASPPPLPPATASSSSISHAQLAEYLQAAGTLGGAKAATTNQLAESRKRIPAWFPPNVWAAFERKVTAIDMAEVYLPVYRKYLTAETLNGLILVYQGPTGQEFARVSTQRVIDAIQQGSVGHAADTNAANAMDANGESALLTKRIKELTPEQRAAYQKAAATYQTVLKPLDDEQNAAYAQKVQDLWHETVKEHNAEILAAQNAASHPHP
ncbi:DUF2059 domain-containing protein [Terracidiphilus gabretensis]|uniref:hypothetical protein n=1 Tax=Terracidiphilus gabretensis TaxID=1577687 RepID=UPI00071B8610|nr:hypothetical protein [Terracidiphilus gabretensis]